MVSIMHFVLYLYACFAICFAEKVLLVSMDGFRWDYIQKVDTPNFDRMALSGSRADYINNTFITKTFPCHYSIATGLYEESHGIVANKMYDSKYNEIFTMSSKETKWWNQGEPIWVTVRKHGLKSAVHFWPGSETEIKGTRPNIWLPYNQSVPFDDRINTVVDWLSNDSLSINLALLYFHEPDEAAHTFGVNSDEVMEAVKGMDTILGTILDKIDQAGLTDLVNILVTSDHGMTDLDLESKIIDLSGYIDFSTVKVMIGSAGPIVHIFPDDGRLSELYNNLSTVANMRAFQREDIPEDWHYKNNRRIPPLLLVADEGWIIVQNGTNLAVDERATHGYDNKLLSMKPIFYAKGPSIRRDFKIEPFKSVDIYPFICYLLGIQPAPNNGSLNIIQQMLMDQNDSDSLRNTYLPISYSNIILPVAVCILLLIGVIVCVYVFVYRGYGSARTRGDADIHDVQYVPLMHGGHH